MINIQSGYYMAGFTSKLDKKYIDTIGVTLTMNQGVNRNLIKRGGLWCLDNGIFTGKFNIKEWLYKLEILSEYKDTCLFIAIPDVVGNSEATLSQFRNYRNMVKDLPVAFISQDGIRKQESKIPWDDFDCLFVGGTNHHKLGKEGGWIVSEARKHKKWIHIGRVNSISRILKFWTSDSWDGTHLTYMPSDVRKFHSAVLQVRSMKKSNQFYEGMGYE